MRLMLTQSVIPMKIGIQVVDSMDSPAKPGNDKNSLHPTLRFFAVPIRSEAGIGTSPE